MSACFGTQPGGVGFRDVTEPLSITSRGTSGQMAGAWVVRAAYPGDDALRMVRYLPDHPGGAAFELVSRTCGTGSTCDDQPVLWRAEPLGNHRWRIAGSQRGEQREVWVIWVDDGFRTAAIGAPDGTYGWILDRSSSGGDDRIAAAREILDFNGYDTSALILR